MPEIEQQEKPDNMDPDIIRKLPVWLRRSIEDQTIRNHELMPEAS